MAVLRGALDPPELRLRRRCCKPTRFAGEALIRGSSTRCGGVEGGSLRSAPGTAFCLVLLGVSAAVIEDCLLVELDADDVVDSSTISTTFQVCSVASGANETRRFAMLFRRAALWSRAACFCAFFNSFVSFSLAAAFCSSSVSGVTAPG